MKRKIVFAAFFALITFCLSCTKTAQENAAKSEVDELRIIAENEVDAAKTMRTIVTSQITYQVEFPKLGFAPDLVKLGKGAPSIDCRGQAKADSNHLCMIDDDLSCSSQWCAKKGYKYGMVTTCAPKAPCSDFVVVATPVSAHTGRKNLCASSDGIIRWRASEPLSSTVTVRECNTWSLL